ncbi:MAG: hypothetical protein WBD90_07850 [Xanthobacteraceae bacterium]|jgi:hypothetical protein
MDLTVLPRLITYGNKMRTFVPGVNPLRIWNGQAAKLFGMVDRHDVAEDWIPTAENINALPPPLRRYIDWLHAEADPQNTIRENYRLKIENAMLRRECERLAKRAPTRSVRSEIA